MKASAGRVLMFVENAYPNDSRVRNEAEALTEAGWSVTVVGLRKKGQPRSEVVNGVQAYRLPRLELFKKTLCENPTFFRRVWITIKSLLGYVNEYVYFTGACFVMSVYVAFKHGFDVIHAHNPPDTLFLVALPWKFFGKKYIFDHHDLSPELYRSRYGARNDFLANALTWVEWGNLKLADVTIATNESYKQIQIQRGGRKPETVFVVRNGPNRNRMQMPQPSERLRNMQKKILVYVGSLNPQDGVDYLLRALRHLVYDLKREDFHCVIIGSGDSLEDLRQLAQQLQLNGYVELTGYIPDEELEEYLAAADICVDPDPSSPLNDVSTWIKVMEYMAYGKPIVSFDLKETRVSAQEAGLFVACNDTLAFAEATAKLMDDPSLRVKMGKFGRERVKKELQWSVVSKNLLAAYASLRFASRNGARQKGEVYQALMKLDGWVGQADWKAYDTFDGLSSPFARFLTFGNPFLKQCWQQAVRRFPINLRRILGIKPGRSTKAMGFFAQGYLRLHQTYGGTVYLEKARYCLEWLMENRCPQFRGYCWGNHFDYQSRGGNISKGTPTIVWTGLIAHAFVDAYEVLGEKRYLDVARSACDFILDELGWQEFSEGVLLRYYPNSDNLVHNSSMIGASLLARVEALSANMRYREMAERAIRYTLHHQTDEGAWYYGVGDKWAWIDSFHTGYVLESLAIFIRATGATKYEPALRKGYRYFVQTFFLPDGTPRYYDQKTLPIDIQCASQAIQTLINLRDLHPDSVATALNVAEWTIDNMQDKTGYFYYRKYPLITNKTPTLHWGQATMFAALALLEQYLHSEGEAACGENEKLMTVQSR